MDLFEVRQQHFQLTTYFRVKKNKHGVQTVKIFKKDYIDKLFEQNKQQEDKFKVLKDKEINVMKTMWKPVSYRQLSQASIKAAIPGNKQQINMTTYKQSVIKKTLIGWDLKDRDGNPRPVSPIIIQKLPPQIFYELYDRYIEYIDVDEEEEKK